MARRAAGHGAEFDNGLTHAMPAHAAEAARHELTKGRARQAQRTRPEHEGTRAQCAENAIKVPDLAIT